MNVKPSVEKIFCNNYVCFIRTRKFQVGLPVLIFFQTVEARFALTLLFDLFFQKIGGPRRISKFKKIYIYIYQSLIILLDGKLEGMRAYFIGSTKKNQESSGLVNFK